MGLDLAHSVLFWGFWAWVWVILGLFGVLGLDFAHFEPFWGVLGLDWAHLCPISRVLGLVLGLDLGHSGPFLPYIGSSGPGFGPF